ncbi:MAG TPA: UDP-N-acetylmuramate dehydrogenase [Methylomirabilota bacterium]|nr:UDP-N-acetylmuramate dehydrogenase [Methylomirabilota bacterium]
MSFHTSLRIGGPAEFLVVPHDIDDARHALLFAAQEGLPVIVVGGGNNLLVSDCGVQAVVLKLQGILSRTQFDGEEAVVGAGVPLSELIRDASAQGLGGLEEFAGIPASIGGALAMHVESGGRAFENLCTAVYFLYRDGTLGEIRPSGGHVFRNLHPASTVLLGCRLRLTRRSQADIRRDIQQRLKQKRTTQPFALASAGYIWKRAGSEPAERLIERAGLRGKRVNSAEISTKCANFVVNRGGATAADVRALMEMMAETVERRFGVTLRPEIRMLGFERAGVETSPRELVAS